MPNENLQQLGEGLKPNLPSGEDLKKKAGSAAIMGTIGIIASLFKNAFKPPKKLKALPKGLVLLGTKYRSGISAIDIASKIIEELKHQQKTVIDKIVTLSKNLEELEKEYYYGNKILSKRYKGEE